MVRMASVEWGARPGGLAPPDAEFAGEGRGGRAFTRKLIHPRHKVAGGFRPLH
jgi:hypothetical protein